MADLLVILLIVAFGVGLSLVLRRVRQPIAEAESPLEPSNAFSALREAVAQHGCVTETMDEAGLSITIRAKIKCFDILLYRVWADRITIAVAEGIHGGSRLVAVARPAAMLFHARPSDPLYMGVDSLVQILAQASGGRRDKVRILTPAP